MDHPLAMEVAAMRRTGYQAGTNHPGYFAFIPYFTTWPAAPAELIAAAVNVSPWAWPPGAHRRTVGYHVGGGCGI